jgi:hypothetical protein
MPVMAVNICCDTLTHELGEVKHCCIVKLCEAVYVIFAEVCVRRKMILFEVKNVANTAILCHSIAML